MDVVSQPWETISTKCMNCGRKLEVPAARRRRAWKLGQAVADFCSKGCNTAYVSRAGKQAQAELLKTKTKP